MTRISRRRFIAAGATVGVSSLAGCATDTFNISDDNTENEYEEITGVKVKETPDGYNQDEDYFAVISDNLQQEYDIGRHQQMRLRIQADSQEQWRLRPAIFTSKVEPDFTSEEENTIWLSPGGLERIFAEPEMIVAAQPFATSPLIDTKQQARDTDDFIEQSITKDDDLLACASSGGDIYSNTGLQALHISSETDASSWACFGYDDRDRAEERFYVRPDLINPDSYNDVRFLIEDEDFDYAVNFIGLTRNRSETIIIGGLAKQSLQNEIRENIQAAFESTPINPRVYIEETGENAGTDTNNIVNRFSEDGSNGIQIAQSDDIIADYWQEVANAVITTFYPKDE